MSSNAPCLHNNNKPNRCWKQVVKGTGYCKAHQPEAFKYHIWGGDSLPRNWRQLSETVIRRDKGICYICGGKGADTADHIIPRHLGGSDALHNLKAIHDSVAPHCHREKTAQEANAAKKALNTFKRRR